MLEAERQEVAQWYPLLSCGPQSRPERASRSTRLCSVSIGRSPKARTSRTIVPTATIGSGG